MNKKSFIFIVLGIAFLVFSILPISNYITDPSRILHHDYKMRYLKFHPHKLFLKVEYLLDNKEKYDTLVYGSSRGGFIDVSRISKGAYNMSHGFGTVTTYLHSLKVLLENGVKVENVWIGINDFDIWKDHTDNLHRLINKNSIIGNAPMYSYWLFRLIPESIKILTEKRELIETQEVTYPMERIPRARKQEHIVKKQSKRQIPAATLGYTGKFRVKEAVEEVAQIKKLCEAYHINLTVFMYPIYYKTYLSYDQEKIEEFKRELVKVTGFYDFYDLGDISLDQKNWFEGSHFIPSIGDYMIKSIQDNKYFVTTKNIDKRIEETRLLVKNMPFLEDGGIYTLDKHTDAKLENKKIIFDIKDQKFTFIKNEDFNLKYKRSYVEAVVTRNDPLIILNKTKSSTKQSLLSLSIASTQETFFQLYYKESESAQYSEASRYNILLTKGINHMNIIIPSRYINQGLRVDIARKLGVYKIEQLRLYEID